MKQIITGLDALKKLTDGAEKLNNCVKITLGPKGRNAALDNKYTTPLITNDGVTIAKDITLECPFENMGASLIKEASIRANDQAGDGTTTACVIACNIMKEGFKNISAGSNPILIRKGIDKAKNAVIEELKRLSKPIENMDEIIQVATISSGDENIGTIIGEAFQKVGKDGIITIEESSTSETYISHNSGYEYERGFASPYMITDANKMQANLSNPYILVTDKKITSINELVPLLEQILSSGRQLLIIADDIENEVLASLVLNKVNANLPVFLTKAPAFAEKRKQTLEDICTITGATLISNELGKHLNSLSLDDLGSAKSIIITKDKTTIIEGCGDKHMVSDLVSKLQNQLSMQTDDYYKDLYKTRIAKLTNGVAIVHAGAPSEIECKELKLRIEDAVSATKSASEEGIVPGGGSTLLFISNKLKNFPETLANTDEKIGAKILLKAITKPIDQIAINSGANPGEVTHITLSKNCFSFGFDALNGEYKDLLENGIIDPTKVTRCALENAASVASTMLTTSCLVTDNKNKNE